MSKDKFDNRAVRSSLEQISSDELALNILYDIYQKNKNNKIIEEYKKTIQLDHELLNKIILYNTLLSLSLSKSSDSKVLTLTKIKIMHKNKYYFISKDILTLPLKSLLNVLYLYKFKFALQLSEAQIIIRIMVRGRDLSPLVSIFYILKLKGDLVSFTIDNNIAIVKVLDMSLYNNILKLLSHL